MQVSPTMTGATVEGPGPFELLLRLELLRSLDDTTLKALTEGIEPVRLQEGEVLVRQGELDDALYAVASGTQRAVTVPKSGEEQVLDRRVNPPSCNRCCLLALAAVIGMSVVATCLIVPAADARSALPRRARCAGYSIRREKRDI